MVRVQSLMTLTGTALLMEPSGPILLLLLFCIHHHVDMATQPSSPTRRKMQDYIFLTQKLPLPAKT